MPLFDRIPLAPPDPILGLSETFAKDPRPEKINLGVGVYKDASGKTPILATVKEAENRLWQSEKSKSYLPIEGSPEYARAVAGLLFGDGHSFLIDGRAVTAQTPGGTGALRVAADFLRQQAPSKTVWLSRPTWPNHPQIFQLAGLAVAEYPYFDPATNALDFPAMVSALARIPAGDVVVLHGCCHNPTGADLSLEQWQEVAALCARGGLLPLVDFAYQGFANGLQEDAAGVRALASEDLEFLVASSFSKNFGLYNERVGALTAVSADPTVSARVLSQIKIAVRANYSNPSFHGGAIVSVILGDPALRASWEQELNSMRDRINGMRTLFVDSLKAQGVARDFSFIARQRGMFSFSGLNPDQVKRLREEHAIYIVGSGRINVAGMTESNMRRLCSAIQAVLA